jgi:RHS repeat-associated protein
VVSRHDYYPFGEEISSRTASGYGGNDTLRQKFTEKRDIETGLDYFGARYYSPVQGRFSSADSFGGSGWNPQTLNRYAHVQNNPLAFSDPTGHMAYPWRINPLDHLFGPRVSEPMFGQDPARPHPNKPCPCEADKDDVVRINVDQKKDQPVKALPPEPKPTLADKINGHDEEVLGGMRAFQSWNRYKTTLPDFSPAYGQVTVHLPIYTPRKIGRGIAFQLTHDRNGNVYFGSGLYVGSPGATIAAGWLLPNAPPEVVQDFIEDGSLGGAWVSPYWVGGGAAYSSQQLSPQFMVDKPGISFSGVYTVKILNTRVHCRFLYAERHSIVWPLDPTRAQGTQDKIRDCRSIVWPLVRVGLRTVHDHLAGEGPGNLPGTLRSELAHEVEQAQHVSEVQAKCFRFPGGRGRSYVPNDNCAVWLGKFSLVPA